MQSTPMEVKKNQQLPEQAKTLKPKNHFIWLGTYAAIAFVFLALYLLLRFNVFTLSRSYQQLTQKISLAIFLGVLILSASKGIQLIILKRSASKYSRYNLIRITQLLSILLVAILFISFLFANWYAAAVSLGLISLLTGFALQTPISSFIAWIYIIVRNPYRIGDRIQIDTFKGDVIEIGYLDTTLWEFAGEYLTNDLPSGRLIRFPNSLILQSPVFNYSWRNFQFIWNEIPFHVAYESDLNYVEKIIKQVTINELGPEMQDRIKELKNMVKDSPVDDMEIKEYPFVSLRINANTWVEVTVTYLVTPKKAATIRSNIIRNILSELTKQPDKVLFPKSNSR
jgi:small-conductance mechanosensitive channel